MEKLVTGAPMTDPHAEVEERHYAGLTLNEWRKRDAAEGEWMTRDRAALMEALDHIETLTRTPTGDPSVKAVDTAAEAMWRAEVAAFPAANYARSSAKWEEQAEGVRVKWTDLARAALSVTRSVPPDPSGAEEMREAAAQVADLYLGATADSDGEVWIAKRIAADIRKLPLPIPRPSTGGTDGRSAEEVGEDIVDRFIRAEIGYVALKNEIATAIRDDRASRATTEARVGEWQPIKTAPRDKTNVLVLLGETIPGVPDVRGGGYLDGDGAEELGYREFAKYGGWLCWNRDGDFFMVDVDAPLGWMPLPDPPSIPTPPASEAGE